MTDGSDELMDHFAANRVVPHIGAAFLLDDVAPRCARA
jgi:hypothetical protein